jgi:hypothetical protein
MHRITQNEGNLITVRVSGKLTQQDYGDLIPAWRRLLAEHSSNADAFHHGELPWLDAGRGLG